MGARAQRGKVQMSNRVNVTVVEQGTRRGIAGVAVTTGDGVETTSSGGTCAIDAAPRARFVWISCPAGRRPVGDFYRPLPADEVVFELAATSVSAGDTARLVQLSDTHVVGPRPASRRIRLGRCPEAALVAESAPDLMIASGDLTNLGTKSGACPSAERSGCRRHAAVFDVWRTRWQWGTDAPKATSRPSP